MGGEGEGKGKGSGGGLEGAVNKFSFRLGRRVRARGLVRLFSDRLFQETIKHAELIRYNAYGRNIPRPYE